MEVYIYISKNRLFLLGLFLFLVMSISGIYSIAGEIEKVETGLSTDAVDIGIKEYNQNNEPFEEDGKVVMPGDEIGLIPRISNLGIDCYLRAKITYAIGDEYFSVSDYIEGNYLNWTKKGEYYYYDGVFESGNSIDLFDKLVIPTLSSKYGGKSVISHIIVEAIQSKNFDGDWSVKIKKSVNRTYDINYNGGSAIIYENDIYDHIKVDSDFFDNLGGMLPGDTESEIIYLSNNSDTKNNYYFSIDYNNLTNEEIDLLKKIKLTVKRKNGDVLVDSTLANKNRNVLGTYSKGEKEEFTVELTLPIDADNDYSKLFAKVMWRFSYDVVEKRKTKNPITWDSKFDLSITIFILSTLGFVIVLIIEKIESSK